MSDTAPFIPQTWRYFLPYTYWNGEWWHGELMVHITPIKRGKHQPAPDPKAPTREVSIFVTVHPESPPGVEPPYRDMHRGGNARVHEVRQMWDMDTDDEAALAKIEQVLRLCDFWERHQYAPITRSLLMELNAILRHFQKKP